MALPTIRLDYWNGSAWVEAKTHKGNSAILECTITKVLNNPTAAVVVLGNPAKDWTSTTASKSKGNLTEIFEGTPFMHCILRDNETGLILFRGRVYNVIDEYDVARYADSLQVFLSDGLKELNDYPIKTTPPSLTQIALNTYDKRSELIELVSTKLNAQISFSDTTKFEPSHHAFTAAEKKRAGRLSDGNYYSDISTSTTNALQLIHDISQADPHDGDTTSKHYGFDYYVDPAITSNATNFSPVTNKPTFNYFERGSRPSADTSAIATPVLHGLTIRYPIPPAWAAISDDLKSRHIKGMLADSRFIDDEEAMYTSAQVTFEETGANELDSNGLGESIQQVERDVEFELMHVTIPSGHFTHATNSTGKAIWEGKRLFYRADKPTDVDTTSGGNGADQSNTAANPHLIYKFGSSNPCAVIHYASGSASGTGADYIILSNVYDASETYEGITFDAFPTDTSSVRFFTRASQGSSATTAPYFDLVPSTGRVATKFGLKRPIALDFFEFEQSTEEIRKKIAATLDRRSVDKVVKGELRINRYPYVKIVSPAANASRSSNVITFSTQSSAAAFTAADDSTKTNDCRVFGAKKGMVIAQMSGNSVTRYAYISALNATTVTYGASATDTSDGTALDSSNPIAIFIPSEPGHMIRVKHDKNDREMDMLIENIVYRLDGGLLTCEILGTGIEENGVGVPGRLSRLVNSSVKANSDKGRTTNLPPNQQTWTLTDGNITPVSATQLKIVANASHVDGPTIGSNGGQYVTVVTSDGQKYTVTKRDGTSGYPYVDIGGSGATLGQPHVLYLRKSGYVDFLDSAMRPAASIKATAASAHDASTTVYNDISLPEDVMLGWAEGDKSRYRYDSDNVPSLVSPVVNSFGADLNTTATSVTVGDGTKFAVGDIIINSGAADAPEEDNSEKMLVTSISSNTLTVIRAINNTTATTHSNGSQIAVIERVNQNTKAIATLQLQGAGSFGDRGSIDVKELSPGSMPGFIGSASELVLGDTANENFVRVSDEGLNFQIPGRKTTTIGTGGTISDSATSLAVADGSIFTVGDIMEISTSGLVTYGSDPEVHEQMKITNISTNTLTVTRGFNGTQAISYNNSSTLGVRPFEGHNETYQVRNDFIPLKFSHNKNAMANETRTSTLLNEALDNSETDITVDSTSGFLAGQYILVDAEIMKITAITNSTTLAVLRGNNSGQGTSSVTHSDNAKVSVWFPSNVGATRTDIYRQGYTESSTTYQDSAFNSSDNPGRGRNLIIHDTGGENWVPEIPKDTTTGKETLQIASRLIANNVAIQAPRFYGSTWGTGTAQSSVHPTYTFSTDLDTGIYQESAGQIDFSVNGTNVMSINSSGDLSVSGSFTRLEHEQYGGRIRKSDSVSNSSNGDEVFIYDSNTDIDGSSDNRFSIHIKDNHTEPENGGGRTEGIAKFIQVGDTLQVLQGDPGSTFTHEILTVTDIVSDTEVKVRRPGATATTAINTEGTAYSGDGVPYPADVTTIGVDAANLSWTNRIIEVSVSGLPNEQLLVTAVVDVPSVNGRTDLTVVRGYNNTTARPLANNAVVTLKESGSFSNSKSVGSPGFSFTIAEDLTTTETDIDHNGTIVGGVSRLEVGNIIKINDEHMKVTALPTASRMTVNRAVDSTTATTHSSGDAAVIQDVDILIGRRQYTGHILALDQAQLDTNEASHLYNPGTLAGTTVDEHRYLANVQPAYSFQSDYRTGMWFQKTITGNRLHFAVGGTTLFSMGVAGSAGSNHGGDYLWIGKNIKCVNNRGNTNSLVHTRFHGNITPDIDRGGDSGSFDHNHYLGTSSLPWYDGSIVNALSEVSDIRQKENVVNITNGLDIITSLTPIQYNKIGQTNVEFGFAAQDVKTQMLALGYTEDIALYVEETNRIDENGEPTNDESVEEKTFWSLKYTELIGPLVAAIKELKAEIDELKNG